MISKELKMDYQNLYSYFETMKMMVYQKAVNVIKSYVNTYDCIKIDGDEFGVYSSYMNGYITEVLKMDSCVYVKSKNITGRLHKLTWEETCELALHIINQ